MMRDHGQEIRDPTLFRFVSFVRWAHLEDPDASETRRVHVEKILSHARRVPAVSLPSRDEADYTLRRIWQAAEPDGNEDRQWQPQTFGITYRETLGTLLGVEQSGLRTVRLRDWVPEASACWTSTFAPCGPWPGADTGDTILGQAWVWTGEWQEEPALGWQQLGRSEYPLGYTVFPWGLLGYRSREAANDFARFDLHTLDVDDARRERDVFLLTSLVIILTEFLKSTEYIWQRYVQRDLPRLVTLEDTIMTEYDPDAMHVEEFLRPGAREERLQKLNATLLTLTRAVGSLEYDTRSVDLASQTVRQQLHASGRELERDSHDAEIAMFIDRVRGQMLSDLAYFQTSQRCGATALQALQVEEDMRNTRAEHTIIAGHLILAVLAIFVVTAIGAWQLFLPLLPPLHPVWRAVAVFAIGVVSGVLLSLASWWIFLLLLPGVYRSLVQRVDHGIVSAERGEG